MKHPPTEVGGIPGTFRTVSEVGGISDQVPLFGITGRTDPAILSILVFGKRFAF